MDFSAESLLSVFWENFESSHVDVMWRPSVAEGHGDWLSFLVSDAGGGHRLDAVFYESEGLVEFEVPVVVDKWCVFNCQRVEGWSFFQHLVKCPDVAVSRDGDRSHVLFQQQHESVFNAEELGFWLTSGNEFEEWNQVFSLFCTEHDRPSDEEDS